MSVPKVYIDGQAGTTGLQIVERLSGRSDIQLLRIDEARRHDDAERARLMNSADLVFLCLPDAAAVEAVKLVTNPETRIIDASTAHRTDPDWVYGFPELSSERRAAIIKAKSRRSITLVGKRSKRQRHKGNYVNVVKVVTLASLP